MATRRFVGMPLRGWSAVISNPFSAKRIRSVDSPLASSFGTSKSRSEKRRVPMVGIRRRIAAASISPKDLPRKVFSSERVGARESP